MSVDKFLNDFQMKESKTVEYWRQPTSAEIKFGEGAIHWLTVNKEDVQKPDGTMKKWFIGKDGLRYNHP